MDVSNTFIPTAGAVGILPMVTYFFLVVAVFVFLGNFIFTLASLSGIRPDYRNTYILTAVIASIAGLSYFLIQAYYRDMLAELASVTVSDDRQTLIRESYNAIGQYRYIGWFIMGPLLLIQVVSRLNVRFVDIKRMLAGLLMSSSFLFFASYIGHQQLSFDNEIQVGQKITWGLIAAIDYVFIFFTLNRLGKQFGEQATPDNQHPYRQMTLIITICWGIYLLGYFLTLTNLDFNWIHIAFTLSDILSIVGMGIVVYFSSLKPKES